MNTLIQKLSSRSSIHSALEGWGLYELVAVMTVILLVLHSEPVWYVTVPTQAFAIAGLLHRPLFRSPAYWLVFAPVLAAGHQRLWYSIDNHEYLLTYWVFGLGLAMCCASPLSALDRTARLLIGLCFAFATLWKIISPEFPNGTFFHFTMLSDMRFAGFADLAGGVGKNVASENARAIADLVWSGQHGASTVLADTDRVPVLAKLLSWWTILIEGSIALAFLLPVASWLGRMRHVMLMLFVVSTYPIATVNGFGWLLLALGLAQAQHSALWVRASYVAIFALLPLYELPFARAFARVLTVL